MESRIRGTLWQRLVSRLTGQPLEHVACPSKHRNLAGRMQWVEEVVDFYQECEDCGKQFFADDEEGN